MTDATRPVYSDSRLAQPPLLFISGQVPLVGGEVPDDIGAQTAACLDRIERLRPFGRKLPGWAVYIVGLLGAAVLAVPTLSREPQPADDARA